MIKLSFLNLFRRKTRTLLSVTGIALGVAAIIVLVSIVDGFTQEFDEVIGGFKAVSVLQKDAQDHTLSRVDSSFEQKLGSIPGVKTVVPELWLLPESIDNKTTSLGFDAISVYGLDSDRFFSSGAAGFVGELEKGSVLSSRNRGEVLIGKGIEGSFNKFVGSTIKINGEKFRVRGILRTESDLVSSIIVMNLSDARNLSDLPDDKVNSFTVFLADPTKDKRVAELIELKHGTELEALTQAELSQEFEGIVGNLRLLAVAIALISSVVGGIGIANTILMSVLERFKEIGALKAVGWSAGNVMEMVVYEALFLGIIGGATGILLGFAVAETISRVFGLKYFIGAVLLMSTFAYAVLLGLVAGAYPAFRASRLNPIEALRA